MKYSAINIQGNILTSEILEKIRREDIRHQKPLDFNLDPNTTVRDEISLAWSVATSNWKAFQQKRENFRESDTGTTETRRFWMMPLLNLMGYDISVATAEIINGKSYAISHRASNLEGFPVHIVGVNQSLDKKAESGGARLSPHALSQEYLNNHEHLYALVTNGKHLRLLRDATLLSRLSFVEFDLEQIMEENLYSEFALLFRLLHSSRMPQKIEDGPESILEFYHVEALASGSRIRERLSKAVEISIRDLANGILDHPANKDLREAVLDQKISAKDFYLYNLRIIYRLLFLLVIEDRKLIYPEKTDEELSKKKDFYYKFYSLQRLTNLAENLIYIDPKKTDLWSSLLTTFSLFEYKDYGDKLGIAPLGSGIFHPNALGLIRNQILDNETLLKVLRYLVSFENENHQRVRVNYADLDVEEFGSVYEGLLEYEPIFEENLGLPVFTFVQGDERSSSGSHYTPEELVKPLIDHSLQYQIEEKLKESDPEKGLLSLTVCDVACGSGHILLSAARRIGFELAKVRSGEDQPTPSLLRIAVRDVIRNCIYGVDLNPLAVELCKVALWLEAHQPGEPLNFLDHHIKCGNAIVGLAHFEELKNGIATEAFKTLPGDDSEVAATFRRANEDQRKMKGQLSLHDLDKVEANIKDIQNDFTVFLSMPEHTPEQIEAKTKAYESLTSDKKWFRLKQLADLQVAQFFIPKTAENREKLTTEATYQNYLNSGAQILERGGASFTANDKKIFHWFLEFPQVFAKDGFDCILGNPPYLGDKKLKKAFGSRFIEYCKFFYPGAGANDLVVYFFRRISNILNRNGFMSLLSTDSISEGDLRTGALAYLIQKNLDLVFAIKSTPWPGEANTNISLVTFTKSINEAIPKYINNKEVTSINSFLNEGNELLEPINLYSNREIVFTGYYFLGDGFLLEPNEALDLLKHGKNKDVIFPCFNGNDLNSLFHLENPNQYIINFFDWPLEKAKLYLEPFDRVLRLVKPVRDKTSRKRNRDNYWIYAENRPGLNKAISKVDRFFCTAQTTKYLNFREVPKNSAITQTAYVVANENYAFIGVLQSNIHFLWAQKYGNTLGSTFRYSPSKVFENFPFPSGNYSTLEEKMLLLLEKRESLLNQKKIGLTQLYNEFHNSNKISEDIDFLRLAHCELDKEVLRLYNWQDIDLKYNFYNIDYLPDNDNIRYTIHFEARKEILNRLLKLNHERFEEEALKGLHKKEDVEAYFKQKGKDIPVEITAQFLKKKNSKPKKQKEIQEKTNAIEQQELFNSNQIMKEFSEHEGLYSINDAATIVNKSRDRVRRWFKKLSASNYEGLDKRQQQDIENSRISFYGLIELVIIGELIDNNFRISKILKAREDLARKTGMNYPFATDKVEKCLKVSGKDITWNFEGGNVTLDGKNQFNLDIIREFFNDIIFKNGLALKILPSKGNKRVHITPKIAGGKPALINSNGVQVETILRFYEGPNSVDDLISDYNISREDIEAALAFQS
jgi:uncharacterized protein (DUF433 family)